MATTAFDRHSALQWLGTQALGQRRVFLPFGAGRGLLEPLGRGAEEQTIGRTGDLGAWKGASRALGTWCARSGVVG